MNFAVYASTLVAVGTGARFFAATPAAAKAVAILTSGRVLLRSIWGLQPRAGRVAEPPEDVHDFGVRRTRRRGLAP